MGYAGFINKVDAKINWYSSEELDKKIELNNPNKPWFRLVLLEAMASGLPVITTEKRCFLNRIPH